ncbi:MAG: pseudouridine-5'-phosphate glycosidase [Clostridia bacterium]|nr:pseudouridine-5'-phosphate glycosidase [Clostridia bacterium]
MLKDHLLISPEVQDALATGKPIIALESTIISHGMPYPQNLETARGCEAVARAHGAVPATCAILGGKLCVGLTDEQLDYLARTGTKVIKASRRDIPLLVARKLDGATTVTGTMILASMAGIRIHATGGIGGVHRSAQETMDISADLEELGKTPVVVVCAGAKSLLDLPLTMEYLETRGVPVIGYGTDELPGFYTRNTGLPVDARMDDVKEIAAAIRAQYELDYKGGMVVANPIPEEDALDSEYIEKVIQDAVNEAKEKGIRGKATTPFLLQRIHEITGGNSLASNIKLVYNNVAVASEIAKHL